MPDPTLKDVLDRSRHLEEFARSIQLAFILLREASAMQGTVEALKTRAVAAQKECEALETRQAGLAEEVAMTRERMLLPVREAVTKLKADGEALRTAQATDQAAFDAERGRRASILRDLEERATQAERDHQDRLSKDREEAAVAKSKLRGEIEELRALVAVAREDLDRTRTEYNQVLEAASRLVRPRTG